MMPIWSKLITPEVEERPRLVTGGYRWHRSQRVKVLLEKEAQPSEKTSEQCSSGTIKVTCKIQLRLSTFKDGRKKKEMFLSMAFQ